MHVQYLFVDRGVTLVGPWSAGGLVSEPLDLKFSQPEAQRRPPAGFGWLQVHVSILAAK
jgi:hypothetical protein